jgi:plastocyanin
MRIASKIPATAVIVLAAAGWSVAAGLPAVAGGVARADAEASRTGAIEGRVEQEGARRKTASRYLGAAAPSQKVQAVPAIVIVTSADGASRARGPHRMMQRDTSFVPAVLVIGVGATVEFPNGDPFFHNVFSYSSAQRFDLGRYPRGESRSVTFDEPGMVKVYCEVHDFMRAIIVVTEHPLHAVVADDGSFSIPGVPAGRQTLLLWHPDHGSREVNVDVREGATTRVELRFP